MEDTIAFKMIQELSGFKHVNTEVIDMCYTTICKQYGLVGDKAKTIEKVRAALAVIFA
jgi:hypothetical protein